MNLYSITQDYKFFIDNFLDSEEPIEFEFGDIHETFEDKCIAIASAACNFDAEAQAIDDAIKNMIDRKKSLENKSQRLRDYLKSSMQLVNVDRINKSPYFVIKIKKNPASVVIQEDAKVPQEYLVEKIEYKPNKSLLKEHLSEGVVIPGISLVSGTRLEIK